MDFDYKEYEKRCDEIRALNETVLEMFENEMAELSPATRNKHLSNVEFYLNDYLLYEDAETYDEAGIYKIDDFLGYFFIRKCMWSTPGTIKSTATSIKKFYKCMLDHEQIQKSDYEYLCGVIKENLPKWQADCEQYNDLDVESPFSFF